MPIKHLPKPPVKSMTDFVVFSFVSIVVFILFSAVIGILITTLVNPDRDNSQTIAILADVTTSLIAALVGFLAGKGTGASEAQEQQHAERMAEFGAGTPPHVRPPSMAERAEEEAS